MEGKFEFSDWIWKKAWNDESHNMPEIIYFRKEAELDKEYSSYIIKITAADRYKLYVNGNFVQAGPQKGTKEFWYLDEAQIASYLMPGKNVLAVEVLRYPENDKYRNDSICRTASPGLYICDKTKKKFCGHQGWRCYNAKHIKLTTEGFQPAPIHAAEHACGKLAGWKGKKYDEIGWEDAVPYEVLESRKAVSPFRMLERTIPNMATAIEHFKEVVCIREGNAKKLLPKWNSLLQNNETLRIESCSRQVIEITAGEETCAYPIWELIGGKGSKITVLWSECYSYPCSQKGDSDGTRTVQYTKGDRTDYVHGRLFGYEETYVLGGYGTEEAPERYEPYWFKTFRYAQIIIETGTEELAVSGFYFRKTGYPLNVKSTMISSDETFASIWDISERTLRLCMHETYFDCPFYEQLQYTMDSRAEILFTYTTAADDRLARQCMESFRCSQLSNGLLKASAPTEGVNVIPGFSVYYILMLHDHMMYFGDKTLIHHHMACVDGILNYFEEHLTEKGLVGNVGGILFQSPQWSFIDWTLEWNDTIGVPTAIIQGDHSLTMESMLYLYGLEHAAELMDYVDRQGVANEYRFRAEQLKENLRKWCVDENGIWKDGPLVREYSVHCQIFAILTGLVDRQEGRRLLETAIGNTSMAQCSFSMSFYLFRALEKIGWYEKADDLWDLWRGMVRNKLTTCVEDPANGRSECHAWGSAILYEFPAVYLGVKPAAPGFEKITVTPTAGHLSSASGDVLTPKGIVHVEWVKDSFNGKMKVKYRLSEEEERK